MEKKVYLAGKISKNGWREGIFNVSDPYFNGNPTKVKDGLKYAGPFFIACDHGCFHSDTWHGRGIFPSGCNEDISESRHKVINMCFQWIESSDIIFCWLDSHDAYGTILEIGYARALNKPIFIFIDEKLMYSNFVKEIWLLRYSSMHFSFANDAYEGWEIFKSGYKQYIKHEEFILYSNFRELAFDVADKLLFESKGQEYYEVTYNDESELPKINKEYRRFLLDYYDPFIQFDKMKSRYDMTNEEVVDNAIDLPIVKKNRKCDSCTSVSYLVDKEHFYATNKQEYKLICTTCGSVHIISQNKLFKPYI